MEEGSIVFETLSEAIAYAFRIEKTSVLNLDRICELVMSDKLFLKHRSDAQPICCSSLTRRRISSTLSSSEMFLRAGRLRTCIWALKPVGAQYVSDGQLTNTIEDLLVTHGPLRPAQMAELSPMSEVDESVFTHFLQEKSGDYSAAEDGSYWFAGQKRPPKMHFESINRALIYACQNFPYGATVEQLHWFLCLSTVGVSKRITRRCVSRELSRRSDTFVHMSRARYALIGSMPMGVEEHAPIVVPQIVSTEIVMPHFEDLATMEAPMNDDDIFGSFLAGDFLFGYD